MAITIRNRLQRYVQEVAEDDDDGSRPKRGGRSTYETPTLLCIYATGTQGLIYKVHFYRHSISDEGPRSLNSLEK